MIDFNGTKVDHVYDYELGSYLTTKLGRMARIDLYDPSNSKVETIEYSYDLFGRTDTITETEGSIVRITDMDYDIEGRVVKITRPEGIINYGYDDATSWHTKTWTSNSEWSYEYDNVGRLDVVTDVGSNLSTDYNYDTIGKVSTITVSQGVTTVRTTTHTYDPQRHWLTKIEHKDGSGANLSTFDYVRRADGQILQVDESVKQPDNTFVVTQQNYTYDALNRLTREVVDTSTTGADFTNEYVLDLVGNRTEKIETKEGQSPVTTTYSYNARDQLLSETDGSSTINYGYNSNGSLTSQSGGGSSRTQNWDIRGRLSGAVVDGVSTKYEYTPDGIRSSVTEGSATTDYIIDGMTPSGYAQVVEELESGLFVVRYTYGSSLDPIGENRGGTVVVYLGDGHSGVRQAIDANGAAVLVQRFDAYGQMAAKAGTLLTPISYRGERFDATLGQYSLRARYYDPASGRFTGLDPSSATYSDPRQSMRFGYAGGNPIAASDPSGKFLVSIAVNIAVGRSGASAWTTTAVTAGVAAMETAVVGLGISGWALSNIAGKSPSGIAIKFGVSRGQRGVEIGGDMTLYFDFAKRALYLSGGFGINSSPTSWYLRHRGWASQLLFGLAFNVNNPVEDIGGADLSATWPARVFARYARSRLSRGTFPTRLAGIYGFNSYLQNLAKYELNAGRGGRGNPRGRGGVVQLQQSLGGQTALLLGGWRGYEFSAGISYSGAIEIGSIADQAGEDVARAVTETKQLLAHRADSFASGSGSYDTLLEDVNRILARRNA